MGELRDRIRLHEGLVYDRHPYGRAPGRDPDLLVRGLEPPSELERLGMDEISPVDLTAFHHKMMSIVEEGRDVYMSLSISEAIITGDMNCSIFTPEGDPAVVATGIYFHTLLNYAPVKYILANYRDHPTMGLRDGDVYFFNDPTAGGVHTFDQFVTAPIFHEGTLIGWAEVGGHQGEVGSVSPGGFVPEATTRWEEGLHIPALRIGENWELRQDIFDFILNSVRNPLVYASDLRARVATCRRIRDRVVREAERRGPAFVAGGLRQILAQGAEQARSRLRELNDGIYRSILFDGTVGVEAGLVRMPHVLIKEDDTLTVLLQGVSPENGRGPRHATWHLIKASLGVYLFTYFFRGLPPNIGLFDPVTILVEGPSVANASDEVAHGEGSSIAAINVQNLGVAGAKLLFSSPHRLGVTAPFSRNLFANIYAGTNDFGYRVANFQGAANGGGLGARFDMDGLDAAGFYWASATDAGEVEEMDMRLPPMTLARHIGRDQHGFGKFRGGAPLVEVSILPPGRTCMVTSWGSADRISQSPGLFGGYAGPPNPRFDIRDTDALDRLREGDTNLTFHGQDLAGGTVLRGRHEFKPAAQPTDAFGPGDVFVYSVGGAGGYGDVLERDPDLVAADVRTGVISAEVARRVYMVVFDAETLEVNAEATERARTETRRERLQLGQPFGEFIERWLQRRPNDALLQHYGHWPEPRVPGYDRPFWGDYE